MRRKAPNPSTTNYNTNQQIFSTTSDDAGERYGRICVGDKKAAATGLEVEKK